MAAREGGAAAVPLTQEAGKKNLVPEDHPRVDAARLAGACFDTRSQELHPHVRTVGAPAQLAEFGVDVAGRVVLINTGVEVGGRE